LARKVHGELAGPGGKGQKGEKTAEKVWVLRLHKTYSKNWKISGKLKTEIFLCKKKINLPGYFCFS